MRLKLTAVFAAALLAIASCAGTGDQKPDIELPTVELDRFMGDWFVIANIPTRMERGAHNAVETYRLADDGSIETTFSFRDGDFEGEAKRYSFRGYVRDEATNAEWGMELFWPIALDYRIAYVDENYTETIIARERRDFVWIMSRTPELPESRYAALLERVASLGYDVGDVERVPQRW